MISLVLVAGPGWAASTHDFSIETTIVSQCTGEAATVSLAGKIVARQKAAGGAYLYDVQSQLNGSAIGETTRARYQFVGTERETFQSATPDAELTLFNNVRVLTAGGEATYMGYDEQTISIDENGQIQDVTHRFDFSCD